MAYSYVFDDYFYL
jgi:fatty acyl-CoA reductase